MNSKVSLPVQLLLIACGIIIFGNILPLFCIRAFYTFSLLFKELLAALVPFMVFIFIVAAIFSFKRKSVPFVLSIIVLAIVLSNLFASFLATLIGNGVLGFLHQEPIQNFETTTKILQPYFSLSIPLPFCAQNAMLAALVTGCFFSYLHNSTVEKSINYCKRLLEQFLVKIFIPCVPLYVVGFMLQLHYEGSFAALFTQYGKIFVIILLLQFLYITLLYFIGSGFSYNKCFHALKNALPSYFTAFSTMSSVASIPVTLNVTKKNVNDNALVDLSVPIMANFHLTGDAITVPMFALMTMLIFTGSLPSLLSFSWFIFYFCMAMFAISGVPGGGIIVILPLLRSILGFDPAMEGIIHTLYLLQDSFGTAANVMSDGGLIIILNKILKKLTISK